MNQAIRNLGGTLGVALVITFTRDEMGAAAMGGFHQTWALLIGCAVTVSVLSLLLPQSATTVPRAVGAVGLE